MKKSRIDCLDYARVFAVLCVILVHSTERIFHFSSDSFISCTPDIQIPALTLFTLGRMGVPVFFFLTGYLVLDKTFDGNSTIAFYRRNLGGLLLTTEIWVILYYIYSIIFDGIKFDLSVLIKQMLFLKSSNISHLWYMPVILGIYLFIPFISGALKHIDIRILYIPLFIAFFYLFVIPVCNVFLEASGHSLVSSLPDFSFAGGVYGFSVLLGYLVRKHILDQIPVFLWVCTGMLSFCFTVFTQFYSVQNGIRYYVWYNSASLFVAALSAFILFTKCRLRAPGWITCLSRDSFGIYLFHNGLNKCLIRSYPSSSEPLMNLLFVFLITLAVSWAVVQIFCMEKHVRKWLFYRK